MKTIYVKNRYLSLKIVLLLMFVTLFGACKKWVEVSPPGNSITSETAFENVITSSSVINNVYFQMQTLMAHYSYLGQIADEIKPRISDLTSPLYFNQYITGNDIEPFIAGTWNNSYSMFIYNLNTVIEGVTASKGLSERNKEVLIAEAKFTRAFQYFYLVNLYGDVPLVLTTNPHINSNISRASIEAVYKQIIEDLIAAKSVLPSSYLGPDLLTGTTDRLRPTKWAALALLARVYLFHGEWLNAEQTADEVIANNNLFTLEPIENVFKKTSKETIWALQPDLLQTANEPNNTAQGVTFIPAPGLLPDLVVSDSLLSKFKDIDLRKQSWLKKATDETVTPSKDYYYSYKYKLGNNFTGVFQDQQEYQVVLRLAEQFLIRAEARAQQERIEGLNSASEDLNVIRERAGLGKSTSTGKMGILNAIWEERQRELFTEWGHRWLDLKRTQRVDAVMSIETPRKGGIWSSYKALFPIPYGEFINNPALKGHQNPGYKETQ